MDKNEAKRILALFRPGETIPNDPLVAEALAMVRSDPEFARWLERQGVWHQEVQSALRSIPTPDDLRARILADRPVVNIWWRRPGFLAAAAAVALMLGLAAFWMRPDPEAVFAAFKQRMVRAALREYQMQIVTNDVKAIRAFVASSNAPGDFVLSQPMTKLTGIGGGVVMWRGQPVSMVCLDLGVAVPEKNRTLWLFVVASTALPDPPRGTAPQFEMITKLTTAGWTEGGKTYLLAGWGDESSLRRYLE